MSSLIRRYMVESRGTIRGQCSWGHMESSGTLDQFEKDLREHKCPLPHTHTLTSGDRAIGLFALTLLMGCHLAFLVWGLSMHVPPWLDVHAMLSTRTHLEHCFLFSSKTVSALKTLRVLGALALHSVFPRRKVAASIRWPYTLGQMPYSSSHTTSAILLWSRYHYLYLKDEEKEAQRGLMICVRPCFFQKVTEVGFAWRVCSKGWVIAYLPRGPSLGPYTTLWRYSDRGSPLYRYCSVGLLWAKHLGFLKLLLTRSGCKFPSILTPLLALPMPCNKGELDLSCLLWEGSTQHGGDPVFPYPW